eukprot:TRINITY_DN57895_c0_g1_i1.p1 TRINITY_DN57895_c0_g1~~TRINITY_DN57895_c0_g1_i1.p1  ORF type:complete len:147 (-),score=46.94 TRINITY_DN57895_c0_g1_i1:27-467(-)
MTQTIEEVLASENAYDILGLPRNASSANIKAAYREMSWKLHPDKNQDPRATEAFQKIQHAHERLQDPLKRHLEQEEHSYHSPSYASPYAEAQRAAEEPVSYTHLRAHETPEHLVCRLLLEKKKKNTTYITVRPLQCNTMKIKITLL